MSPPGSNKTALKTLCKWRMYTNSARETCSLIDINAFAVHIRKSSCVDFNCKITVCRLQK